MTGERVLPGLGLTAFWDTGTDGWGAGMDANIRVISGVAQLVVASKDDALPSSPSVGDIHIVVSSDGTNGDDVAIWDGVAGSEAWVYITPIVGWMAYITDLDETHRFAAGGWEEFSSGGGGGALPNGGTTGQVLAKVDATNGNAEWVDQTGGGGGGSSLGSWVDVPGTNLDFETGDTTGWTVETGTPGFAAPSGWPGGTGSWVIIGAGNAFVSLYQDFDITGSDVLFYEVYATLLKDFTDNDTPGMQVHLLDTNDDILFHKRVDGARTGADPEGGVISVAMRAGATTLRVFAIMDRNSGSANNCGLDAFKVRSLSLVPAVTTITEITDDYTLLAGDLAGNLIRKVNKATAVTVTVDTGLTAGEPVTFVQVGDGQVSFVAGAGVTIQSAGDSLKLRVPFSSATLVPTGSETYILIGDIVE